MDTDKLKSKEKLESETSTSNSRKRRHTRIKVRKKDKVDVKQQFDSTKRQKVELKGPRVKHVCRSASIVLGQPLATFPLSDDKNLSDVSDDNMADETEKIVTESKVNLNLASECCTNCESVDKDHSCGEENVTDDEASIAIEEMDVVKDDESSDSFDSIVSKDMNKENNPIINKTNEGVDNDKEENAIKNDIELTVDTISQKKSAKQILGNLSNVYTLFLEFFLV